MATLSFEGETHGEIVQKVRRWLASLEGQEEGDITVVDAINQGAELTKDALRIIASAAPSPIADHDIVKGLTGMGYKATDATKAAILDGLDSVEQLTGGDVVKRVQQTGRKAAFQMSSSVARQVLRTLRG